MDHHHKSSSSSSGASSGSSSGASSGASSRSGTMNGRGHGDVPHGDCVSHDMSNGDGFHPDSDMSGSFILMSPTNNTQQASLLAALDEANR